MVICVFFFWGFLSFAGCDVDKSFVNSSWPLPVFQPSHRTHRVRRFSTKERSNFNEEEKEIILKRHNDLRKSQGSSNMIRLEWSAEVERSALHVAEMCSFKHSSDSVRSNKAGYRILGENIHVRSTAVLKDVGAFVHEFNKEEVNWDYEGMKCKQGKCGHYTQVVWPTTEVLGCAAKWCDTLIGVSTFTKGSLYVCHYGPNGNINLSKSKIYKKGPACSACPKGFPHCNDQMCSKVACPPDEKSLATRRSYSITLVLCLLLCSYLHR
ncbi:peptidase inhibitor 16-like [Physella acuta]|uniref:peptidase inhibitor 16-like n=1 Tax=Physella acuta TaxID=109671 RepID=UPI0027DD6678|nr:peptidase inhibitor 16-like [Physella acuta]